MNKRQEWLDGLKKDDVVVLRSDNTLFSYYHPDRYAKVFSRIENLILVTCSNGEHRFNLDGTGTSDGLHCFLHPADKETDEILMADALLIKNQSSIKTDIHFLNEWQTNFVIAWIEEAKREVYNNNE